MPAEQKHDGQPGQLISAVAEVAAPDGSTFGMLRWAPGKAGEIRGRALVKMKELVKEREPESLSYLNTNAGLSAEYATSSAIIHVKDKGLKADLVRVAVQRELEEGFRDGAIRMLEYSNAAELDLPEYGEQFALEQYDLAMKEGNFSDAYMLAVTMLRNGRKAVKTETPAKDAKDKGIESWAGKEENAFGLYARQILDAYKEGVITGDDWRLRSLFDSYRFRKDGYDGVYVSALAQEVAEANVKAELERGMEWVALQKAITAKLPDDFVRELRKKVSPNTVDKLEKWVNGLRERVARILPRN